MNASMTAPTRTDILSSGQYARNGELDINAGDVWLRDKFYIITLYYPTSPIWEGEYD